jgi:hypothetical protein
MMDPPKDEMMEMMEEEKPLVPTVGFGGEDSDDEYRSLERKENLTQCCCCMCVCHNDLTKDLTCCCCCPIKFGVQFIGGLTMVLTFYYISWNFFLILNDQVVWWFPVVTIGLLIPLYVASGLFVYWFIKDTLSTRGPLTWAIILSLASIFLVALWNVIYYTAIYKRDEVFIGYGVSEDKYQKFQKKYYLFKVLLEAAILMALYAYFQCVIQTYKDALRERKEEKMEDEKMDEPKKD